MPAVDVLIRLLPFQMIATGSDVILRRGAHQLVVEGEGVANVIAQLQEDASEQFLPRSVLLARFPPVEQDQVDALLHRLAQRRFLELQLPNSVSAQLPAPHSPDSVFFWQFGLDGRQALAATERRIVIVGVNQLGLEIGNRLAAYGRWSIAFIDDIPLRNHKLFAELDQTNPVRLVIAEDAEAEISAADVVVACAEFGGIDLLKPWNAMAFRFNRPFFPVLIDNLTARLGPLSVPEETACLECLDMRLNSHLKNKRDDRHQIEALMTAEQDLSGTHPAVVAMAAPLAAFELLRHAVDLAPRRVGKLIELNLIWSSMITSRVLRAPRCPVCSPMRHAGLLSLEKVAINTARWEAVEEMGLSNARG